MAAARDLAVLLRGLVNQYRALHGGEAPERIYVSADVFESLEREKDPLLALKRTGSAYTFDGVAIEPRQGQSLPFVLRP